MIQKLIFILIVIFFSSCKKKEFLGTYVANHKKGLDTLRIYSDFTYEHIFFVNKGNKYQEQGRWESGIESGWIDFENYNFHIQGYSEIKQDSTAFRYWAVEIEYDIFGNPFFTIDQDRNFYYKKVTARDGSIL